MPKKPKFKRGDIIKLKSDILGYGVAFFSIDCVFYEAVEDEYLYRISGKEKHSDAPRQTFIDGLGFELAPKESKES